MVQTRSQQKEKRDPGSARSESSPEQVREKDEGHPPQKRSAKPAGKKGAVKEEKSPKRRRKSHGSPAEEEKRIESQHSKGGDLKAIANNVLEKYGETPLKDLVDNSWPESQVVMAHILNAMLSSARISHDIARSTLKALLDAKYNDLEVLHKSSWDERTEVLTKGGYVRYRERMANFLGDLMELMKEKYGTDFFAHL